MPTVFAGSASYPSDGPRPMLTIGNFDGLHHGHRHLISTLVKEAQNRGIPSAVYTFDPPPRVVLAPTKHPPRIQTWTDKVHIMGELGVNQVVVERFTRAFAQHPPSWFLSEVLASRIQPAGLVIGYDFRFGRGRTGDADTVRAAFPDLPIVQVQPLMMNGDTVSSSRIRAAVVDGRVKEAAHWLGCAHRIRGTVVRGDARGRTIGFPTANIETDSELIPSRGVYAVRARTNQGEWMDAVANLGTRPTFDGRSFLVEVHLINFSEDLYGSEMDVAFVERLRGEVAFTSPEDLAQQIQIDVAQATEVLNR